MIRTPLIGMIGLTLALTEVLLWAADQAPPKFLVLASFNDPEKNANEVNDLGGKFGAWYPEGSSCQHELAEDALKKPEGHSLKVMATLAAPNPYAGEWLRLGKTVEAVADLSEYDRLGVWYKATAPFALEIKDGTSDDKGGTKGVATYAVREPSQDWKRLEIPFKDFKPKGLGDQIDWKRLRQIVIVFSDLLRSGTNPVLQIDELYASKGPRLINQ